jgi:colanic acid/amylovoran biosynthesis glycosyltransferase
MRLAVFTNQFPTRVSTFFARDMRGLLEAGIDIDVFPIYPLDPNLWRYVPDILNQDVLPRHKVHHINFLEAVSYVKIPSLRRFSLFLRDTMSISACAITSGVEPFVKTSYVFPKAWIWAQEQGNQYDHVLAYWGNYTATCAYLFHRLLSCSIPFSIFLHAGIDLFLNRVYLREKLLAATHIITCSDFNRLFIKEHFSDVWNTLSNKIHVHYHGLDFKDFAFESNQRPLRKLLAVGRIDEWKGFEYLLHAMRELMRRGVDCELEFVGDGKEKDALIKLADSLQVSERVTFRGWVLPEEVAATMRDATILVHPSSKLGDGVPNVIKEAMALGTPVIGSDIAGIPELLRGGELGILVPPRDVNSLADAIQRLLTNQSLREQYAESAKLYAMEKFDLWRNGRVLADVLRLNTAVVPPTSVQLNGASLTQ